MRRARSSTPEQEEESHSKKASSSSTTTEPHHYDIYLLQSSSPLISSNPPSKVNSTLYLFIVNSNQSESIQGSVGILYTLKEKLGGFQVIKDSILSSNLVAIGVDLTRAVLLGWVEENLLPSLETTLFQTSLPIYHYEVDGQAAEDVRDFSKEWILDVSRRLEEEGGMLANSEILIRHALS